MFLNFYGFQAVYISYKGDIRVVNGLSISEALKSRPVFRLVAKTYFNLGKVLTCQVVIITKF